MANLVVESVPPADTGVATGMNFIVRTVGGVIGTQVGVSIVASHVTAAGVQAERGYLVSFVISAVALFVAAVVSLFAPPPVGRRRLPFARTQPTPAV